MSETNLAPCLQTSEKHTGENPTLRGEKGRRILGGEKGTKPHPSQKRLIWYMTGQLNWPKRGEGENPAQQKQFSSFPGWEKSAEGAKDGKRVEDSKKKKVLGILPKDGPKTDRCSGCG